ncbi:MAG: transketolase [Phycisphaerales bacterium]|nr:transketolase [Phycisphaerales bacterium]
MSFDAAVHAKAIRLDTLALQMTGAAGSGHPTTATSLGHITTVLMYHAMRWVPEEPALNTADRLVLSEGHAVPIVYAAFIDLGAMVGNPGEYRPADMSDIDGFRATDSPLDGHPNPREGFAFFDAATGSLGQGLSVAAGLGAAARGDGIDQRIFCIVGDGESREGQVWEAVDSIVEMDLRNVLPIFNCNGYGQAGAVSSQQSPDRIAAKLQAAGMTVLTIDGHNPTAIRDAVEQFTNGADGPIAIVANTVKGWGIPSMQGGGWHGKPATGEKLEAACQELAATGVALTTSLAGSELAIYPPTTAQRTVIQASDYPSFREAMAAIDQTTVLQVGRLATRKAFGIALRIMGKCDNSIWAVDADVRNSTFLDGFADDPATKDRFVDCKIGEQNMISVAAGISAAGKNVFTASFGKFLTRGYDQIEMAMNSGANMKIVGSHCGISLAADGPSQMALPDVAWFRSLGSTRDHNGNPGCYVLQPADAWAAYGLTTAMGDYEGMCYMRVFRPEVEFLYDENTVFDLGGMEVLTEGRDLLIVSAGYMLHECNKSLDALDKMGIDASLLDLYSLPFDEDRLLDLANANGGNVLVVEDNYGGGLFSAVAEACCKAGDAFTIEPMHVTRIPKSSLNEASVLEQCGMHHEAITARAASMLGIAAHVH